MKNDNTRPCLLLAHGAGSGANSTFMVDISQAIEAHNIDVIRFNFPFMQWSLANKKPRPPEPMPKLIDFFKQQVGAVSQRSLWIGGKSMGARVAVKLSELSCLQSRIHGVLAYGYPFHPLGKPEKTRLDDLHYSLKPIHILQGERDKFGDVHDVAAYSLPSNCQIHWIPNGDHGFCPLKKSGYRYRANIDLAATITANIILAKH